MEKTTTTHCNIFLMRSLRSNFVWLILKTAAAAAKKNSRNVEKVWMSCASIKENDVKEK